MIKAILLDLDDVLIHEGFNPPILCNETLKVLDYLKGYKMVLVSHNDNGLDILKSLKLQHYFTEIISFSANTKFFHLVSALEKLNLKGEECLLCDDLKENICMATTLKIHGLLINYETGIKLDELRQKINDLNEEKVFEEII